MRTDESLGDTVRNSQAWHTGQAAEYSVDDLLSTRVPPRWSFSGGERNHFFASRNGKQFDDLSALSGMDSPADSRSFALLDYDRDGWQDIIMVNISRPTVNLFHNEIGRHSSRGAAPSPFIAVRLVGGNHLASSSTQFSSRDGYGASIRVQLGQRTLLREHRCGEGHAAQNSSTMLVGIGASSAADEVRVRWPSGREQSLAQVPAESLVTFYENPADSPSDAPQTVEPYPFTKPQRPDNKLAAPANVGTRLILTAAASKPQRSQLRMYTTMATWCSACKRFLPQLAHVRDTFDRQTLSMFGVPADANDGKEDLAEYVQRYHPQYELITDLEPSERQSVEAIVTAALKVEGALPATIVTDTEGNVLLTVAGVPSVSAIRELVSNAP